MAWGQEKGTDVKISALPVSMRFFDFVPCSLPLKTLILLTFSCFLIRRRGRPVIFCYSLSKNYASAPVSAIIEETGVFSWKAGEKMHGMSQSS